MKKSLLIILFTTICLTACGSKNAENGTTDTFFESDEASSDTTSEDSASTAAAGYQLSIPKDFSELEIEGMEFYYGSEDGSSVSLNLRPKDPTFSQVSAELLKTALSTALQQTYGEDVSITDNYFTTEAVSGFPAYQYSISYELQGIAVTQIIIGIDADQTYTFTYTDLAGTWIDTFEDSIETITLTAK